MEQRIADERPITLTPTHRLQAVPPVQTVWLAVPITSEFVQKQHIFWSDSVPQQQPAAINANVEHSGKSPSQHTTKKTADRWTSCNCFIKISKSQPHNLIGDLNCINNF